MSFRITSQQKDMLIKVKEHFKWEKKLNFEEQPTGIFVKELEKDDVIDLRELCSDYLLEAGFDEDYVANEEGKILEQLVDKLYIK
jgi:hypothetical protein